MPINRRDFIRTTAAAAAVAGGRVAAGAPLANAFASPLVAAPRAESFVEDLAMEALNAARDSGASYADARIGLLCNLGVLRGGVSASRPEVVIPHSRAIDSGSSQGLASPRIHPGNDAHQ